jgi:hypothetical protein
VLIVDDDEPDNPPKSAKIFLERAGVGEGYADLWRDDEGKLVFHGIFKG